MGLKLRLALIILVSTSLVFYGFSYEKFFSIELNTSTLAHDKRSELDNVSDEKYYKWSVVDSIQRQEPIECGIQLTI